MIQLAVNIGLNNSQDDIVVVATEPRLLCVMALGWLLQCMSRLKTSITKEEIISAQSLKNTTDYMPPAWTLTVNDSW